MVEFKGRAAHAASQPDLGINALDGILQLFNNVNAMRQQLRPDARVHGIITSGGSAVVVTGAGRLGVVATGASS